MEKLRLQKYFTDCGVLSRRAAEAEIAAGRVLVNGTPAVLGMQIDPETDKVVWKGKEITPRQDGKKHYFLLHKPRGYVTTLSDEKGRRTVADLLKPTGLRLYPVGRLDMDSDGLLLMTDDGALANKLTHPRHEIAKIYEVTVKGTPTVEQLNRLTLPFLLDGYRTLPVAVTVLSEREGNTVLRFPLYEGRNRQIRRMCKEVSLRILSLTRVAIGELTLADLPLGKYRPLTEAEVRYLTGSAQK